MLFIFGIGEQYILSNKEIVQHLISSYLSAEKKYIMIFFRDSKHQDKTTIEEEKTGLRQFLSHMSCQLEVGFTS